MGQIIFRSWWINGTMHRIFKYISKKMQGYTVYLYLELVYIFRVVPPPIIRSTHKSIYSFWYLSNRWNWVPTLPRQRQVAITVWQIPDVVDKVVCAPDDVWRYHPKHVEQCPDINKLCNFASCWMYIGIYLRCTEHWTLKKYRIFVKLRRGSCIFFTISYSLFLKLQAPFFLYIRQPFLFSPENAFYIFNQQIYFIFWYLIDRASLI
jgi:hypothetical protein